MAANVQSADPDETTVDRTQTAGAVRRALAGLQELITNRSQREQELESRLQRQLAEEESHYQTAVTALHAAIAERREQETASYRARRAEQDSRRMRERAALDAEYRETLSEVERTWKADTAAAQKNYDESDWLVTSILDSDSPDGPQAQLRLAATQVASQRSELELLLEQLDRWDDQATSRLSSARMLGDFSPPPRSALPSDSAGLYRLVVDAVPLAEKHFQVVNRAIVPRLYQGFVPFVLWLLLGLAFAAALRLGVDPTWLQLKLTPQDRDWQWMSLIGGLAVSLIVTVILHVWASRGLYAHYLQLSQLVVDGHAAHQRWTVVSQQELEERELELKAWDLARNRSRQSAQNQAAQRLEQTLADVHRTRDEHRAAAEKSFPPRMAELDRLRSAELKALDDQHQALLGALDRELSAAGQTLGSEHQRGLAELREQQARERAAIISDWTNGLAKLAGASRELQTVVAGGTAGWSEVELRLNAADDEPPSRPSSQAAATTIPAVGSRGAEALANDPTFAGAAVMNLFHLAEFDSLSAADDGATKSSPADVDSQPASAPAPSAGASRELQPLGLGAYHVDLQTWPEGLSRLADLPPHPQQFDWPLAWSPAEYPMLIVRSTPANRGAANQLLQLAMLRWLTTLPAGQVRFTVFDPVGLGANFGAFMHLADADERLMTHRIWTESTHLEQRLADLSEHVETVLQTYLRSEYPDLDAYNRVAGDVAEPYRVLVLADVPAGLSEVAWQRLRSLAASGRRCGVYLMLSVDDSQALPRGVSLADWERDALVIQLRDAASRRTIAPDPQSDLASRHAHSSAPGSELAGSVRATPHAVPGESSNGRVAAFWQQPSVAEIPLQIEALPGPETLGRLIRLVSQQAVEARRVQVPFSYVVPPADAFWKGSTRFGVSVPIGRAGATRWQAIELGQGTSQHVLVAGKTGSGKSSLLHALLTNAALIYSPDELELYLIDFKKGVEFQAYATSRMPHARIVAIESDREFGVAVLQRLDALLTARGVQFRDAGVQDLASFREAQPGVRLPRVLLVIDEFQEFFVEDDPQAQAAALLFDRLIRQGRAFGVHVILGSQTLAGTYSLARSTLGQIAIRIALQCSESDAHLILSEENTAARLLSRPGEAIYNDANGRLEGNHHFQVVWLDEAERQRYLQSTSDWMNGPKAKSLLAGRGQTIVFEGNRPADPTQNPDLLPRWREPAPTELTRTGWLGDSLSLSGRIALKFGPRDGGPLLLVGRDESAALGVLANLVLAMARSHHDPARFVVLDGSLPDSAAAAVWQGLSQGLGELPQKVDEDRADVSDQEPAAGNAVPEVAGPRRRLERYSPRQAGDVLRELMSEVTRRADDLAPPIFVVVFDIARFRDLKKSEDDFGFGNRDAAPTPASLWTELIKEGPSAGVFPLVWADLATTAQRWLGRDLLGRFETRVLFAMNANDSSQLIETPAASKLGSHRALLYRGETGTIEKFRPYQVPDADWLRSRGLELPVPPPGTNGSELDQPQAGDQQSAVAVGDELTS